MRLPIVLSICALLHFGANTHALPPTLDASFVGSWHGTAEIVVNWTKQRTLQVELTIDSDGAVTGRIGDARIIDGRFDRNRGPIGRALGLGTDFIITGRLEGPVIASEEISRDSFTMPINFRNEAFAGGLHAGRSKLGGREHMMLSATRMRLIRGPSR